MRLSKTERTYKKRLFAFLKIKRRKSQKKYTAMLTKTEAFKKGGFRGVYHVYRTAIPRLSMIALQKITEAVANFDATITEDKHQEE